LLTPRPRGRAKRVRTPLADDRGSFIEQIGSATEPSRHLGAMTICSARCDYKRRLTAQLISRGHTRRDTRFDSKLNFLPPTFSVAFGDSSRRCKRRLSPGSPGRRNEPDHTNDIARHRLRCNRSFGGRAKFEQSSAIGSIRRVPTPHANPPHGLLVIPVFSPLGPSSYSTFVKLTTSH
jgi:hypothetical protein